MGNWNTVLMSLHGAAIDFYQYLATQGINIEDLDYVWSGIYYDMHFLEQYFDGELEYDPTEEVYLDVDYDEEDAEILKKIRQGGASLVDNSKNVVSNWPVWGILLASISAFFFGFFFFYMIPDQEVFTNADALIILIEKTEFKEQPSWWDSLRAAWDVDCMGFPREFEYDYESTMRRAGYLLGPDDGSNPADFNS